jgi:hypothetical protein
MGTASRQTVGEAIFGQLNDIDPTNVSVEQLDGLRRAAYRLVAAIDDTPVMLLRTALEQVEENDGSMTSEAASYAAQAIDAAYPDWGGVIEAALDEQFQREMEDEQRGVALRR